jgi:Vacuolar protein sorting-associated protein 62
MRVAALTILVSVVLVPAAAADADQAPSLAALLARHVPILVLHPAEQIAPAPVDGYLADADLQHRSGSGWELVPGSPRPGGEDQRLDQRACRAVDGVAATACYASAQAAHGAAPVVYGAAFRRGQRIDLQYWLWYPFNAYSPSVLPSELWQVHEGDWEAVSVVLDRAGKPLVVGLSRHSEGVRRSWARAPKRGRRPLVYVGLGSHANFFGPGEHRLDPRFVDPALISIIRAYGGRPVDFAGVGRTVRPKLVRVTAASPEWMAWAGAWGEDAYIHAPDNAPIRYGLGPTDPAFHEQWRAPVREVLSWPSG